MDLLKKLKGDWKEGPSHRKGWLSHPCVADEGPEGYLNYKSLPLSSIESQSHHKGPQPRALEFGRGIRMASGRENL